jgi:hypothetical protein
VKGHDFSRAENAAKRVRALAPEECFSDPTPTPIPLSRLAHSPATTKRTSGGRRYANLRPHRRCCAKLLLRLRRCWDAAHSRSTDDSTRRCLKKSLEENRRAAENTKAQECCGAPAPAAVARNSARSRFHPRHGYWYSPSAKWQVTRPSPLLRYCSGQCDCFQS